MRATTDAAREERREGHAPDERLRRIDRGLRHTRPVGRYRQSVHNLIHRRDQRPDAGARCDRRAGHSPAHRLSGAARRRSGGRAGHGPTGIAMRGEHPFAARRLLSESDHDASWVFEDTQDDGGHPEYRRTHRRVLARWRARDRRTSEAGQPREADQGMTLCRLIQSITTSRTVIPSSVIGNALPCSSTQPSAV